MKNGAGSTIITRASPPHWRRSSTPIHARGSPPRPGRWGIKPVEMPLRGLSQTAAAPAARTSARRVLVLLIAMTAIGPMTLNILTPAVPGLAATFAADPATVQLTLSLYLLGLAVSQLVMGPLSDRFGRRP